MSLSQQQHYLIQKIKEMSEELGRIPTSSDFKKRFPNINVIVLFGSHDNFLRAAGLLEQPETIQPRQPKILVFDIETKPLITYAWGLFDQNIGLDMIIEDWSIMSWAAKWIGKDEVMYQDVSSQSDYTDDQMIVCGMHELLNEADVVVTQNGIRFDEKKLNTKFEKYKLGRPSPYKHIDALKIKRKHFALTSNKLQYTTEYFNEKYKKQDHGKFPGFKLWKECLAGNKEAWSEMKQYNIHDVLALEEEYLTSLIRWDNTINYGVYTQQGCCPNCGSMDLIEAAHDFTKAGAFSQVKCKACGTYSKRKTNELKKAMKKELLR